MGAGLDRFHCISTYRRTCILHSCVGVYTEKAGVEYLDCAAVYSGVDLWCQYQLLPHVFPMLKVNSNLALARGCLPSFPTHVTAMLLTLDQIWPPLVSVVNVGSDLSTFGQCC